MFVLLPPSEAKRPDGDGPPLELSALGFPGLDPVRSKLVDELVGLAADVPASLRALGLGPRQSAEVAGNARLWTAPTTAALRRYTGVLYDALDPGSLSRAELSRAEARLVIGSALFGALRATDPIPRYRLSAGTTLPGAGTVRSWWRPVLPAALTAADELIVDLRSGAYAALGPVPGGVTVTVLTEAADGSRTTVSHFNKAHKGLLARALARTRAEPTDARGVARIARRAGLRVELHDHALVLLT